MPVQVNDGRNIRHNGTYYEGGDVIENISDESAAELVALGAATDLDGRYAAQAQTLQAPAGADELGAPIQNQVAAAAASDVAQATATLEAPGTPVSPQSGQPSAADVAAAAESA